MINSVSSKEFENRLKWTLTQKIDHAFGTIDQFYNHHNGKVYVAFSGGKDSTVLLWLTRKLFPDVVGVFSDTGLEFPEIRNFVKLQDNIVWVKPAINFREVINSIGFPVVSKMQAQYIEQYRNGSEYIKKLRWYGKEYNGIVNYKISDSWKFMINAPFKISDKCCDIMKKKPMILYEKESGNYAIIGNMATESIQRKKQYLQHGCNIFNKKNSSSRPLSFFYDTEIWQIIKKYKLKYSSIYDMGYNRTGCMFCLFGVHLESPNRFQLMAKTHPKQYDYCMNKLGVKEVMQYMKLSITPVKCLFPPSRQILMK
jgi:3'-phosphoadenosine 5'-phosphosulfate sulfotransferase (PAPS reductase)/FAD synthetase